jgi:hypothetical protein
MLKKIVKALFGGGPSSTRDEGFFLHVRCDRCAEEFHLFINMATDLAQEFDDNEALYYRLNKEIIGANCRNLIRVKMTFDGSKNLVFQEIINGTFIEGRQ